jgi:hypothetical protein
MYESLEKFDNTKLEGVWFWNKDAPFVVWDLHHKSDGLVSILGMILKVIFYSFVRLEAYKP